VIPIPEFINDLTSFEKKSSDRNSNKKNTGKRKDNQKKTEKISKIKTDLPSL
jgi:hypothetical protein